MAFEQRSLDDYVDVATRIADFRERYPEGTLQPADPARPWEQAVVNGIDKDGRPFAMTMIVYTAAAYRTPDDPRPGIGIAWERFPGKTPYTLGSELMNAETSAWGRAIIAVGASDSKRGIASREEVRNRQAERDTVTYELCQCGHNKDIHAQRGGCLYGDVDCECMLAWNKDGSLSRSRTTDEQKEQIGVLTSAQQKKHTALRPKASEIVQGLAAGLAASDVWIDGQPPPSEIDQDTPGTISRQQQSAMHAAFAALGITDRGKRLEWTREALGLPDLPSNTVLATSSSLSYRQAGTLLEKLEQRQREGARA